MFNPGTIIKTGICSYGMSGKLFHAPFLEAHPGFELSAIVERNRDESRERYPHSTLYRSVEEMLQDESLQLIIVNGPTATHYDQALAVLQAGKHLVMEKPMVLNVQQGEALIALAQQKGLFISVYQNRRYDGDFHAVRDVLDQELIGDLREMEVRFDRFRPHFSGKMHKEGNLPGAGIVYDLSPHLVDQILQLFGWPVALFADITTMRAEVQAPDYFELLLFYPTFRVRLKATCIARESNYAYVLHGMKGSFLQQRSDLQEQQLLAGVKPSLDAWCKPTAGNDGILHTDINGEAVRKETKSIPGNYMAYYEGVYRALTGQGPNPVPAEEALQNIRIIEAAMQSAAEKRVISL